MDKINEKSWDDFRKTGLFMFINGILHVFGWVLVVEVDAETQKVNRCFPARTVYRGFSEADSDEMYKNITEYMRDNSQELLDEVNN